MDIKIYAYILILVSSQVIFSQTSNSFYDPNCGTWRVAENFTQNSQQQSLLFSWQSVQTPVTYQLMRVFFADSLHGWIGHNGTGGLRSTDGGFNWNTISFNDTNFTASYQGVYFLDQYTGWMNGSSLQIRKTTDGGVTWFKQTPPPVAGIFHSITFFDSNTGIAIGSKNYPFVPMISKSTNGGSSWVELNDTFSGAQELNNMYWFNSSTGWIAGYNVLLYTTNGGQNFTNLFSNVPPTGNGYNNLLCVWFANQQTGWLGGGNLDKKNIYKTTNGGANWIFQDNPVSQNNYYVQVNDVTFMTQDSGWAIHGTPSTGAIMSTTNGGVNWVIEQGTSNWYQAIYVYNRSKAWVASSSGQVWYSNLNQPVGIHNEESPAKNFYLSQNYPNPFNPSTTINYTVPNIGGHMSVVRLLISDVMGREIATLVNGLQKPGFYSVNFDGSNVSSGLYFYTLKVNQFTETKKMLMIK